MTWENAIMKNWIYSYNEETIEAEDFYVSIPQMCEDEEIGVGYCIWRAEILPNGELGDFEEYVLKESDFRY